MKKNVSGLLNVFSAFEKEELSEDQLNIELIKVGISPDHLLKSVQQRIEKLKSGKISSDSAKGRQEFNPYLVAAGNKKDSDKKEKLAGKLKKRPKSK